MPAKRSLWVKGAINFHYLINLLHLWHPVSFPLPRLPERPLKNVTAQISLSICTLEIIKNLWYSNRICNNFSNFTIPCIGKITQRGGILDYDWLNPIDLGINAYKLSLILLFQLTWSGSLFPESNPISHLIFTFLRITYILSSAVWNLKKRCAVMAEKGFKRNLTAILSADAVEYSRLMGDDKEATEIGRASCRERV